MQKPVEQSTFCGVCRHLLPGHEENCPVLTGEPVAGVYQSQQGTIFQGYPPPMGINPQDLQPMPASGMQTMQGWPVPQMAGLVAPAEGPVQGPARNMIGSLSFLSSDGYEVAKIYREARERLLEELKVQVQVNHQLSRELIDLRLEHAELQSRFDEVVKIAQQPPPEIDPACPF